ncbi:MAG: hypothetical protein HRT44_06105, partial [Bdellovibrionales bacterium]|nr:hypothetical protein [Bdellovibrionales bacterium]NQZ18816.1 hypothetical protein [Bdellovibrionales bacterium]
MNLKTLGLILAALLALGACGGDKQDQNLDTDYTLLSRNSDQGEMEMAVVPGQFESAQAVEDYAKANPSEINWEPVNNQTL